MWLVAFLLLWSILQLPPLVALLIAAIITPTDPVVATSLVTGNLAQEKIPLRVRTTLSLESGANDGFGFLLVILPVLLIQLSPGDAWSRWFLDVLLWDVLFATVAGALLGYLAAKLLHMAEAREILEEYSYLSLSIALTILALGAVELFGADGILAVFAAGLVFDFFADTKEQHDEERIQETMSNLFMVPMFVLIGLTLPWSQWFHLGWPLLAAALAVLLLRRLPLVWLMHPWLRSYYTRTDMAFLGWFGPVGVTAVYYAHLAESRLGEAWEIIWPLTSLLVFASIFVHGMTAAPVSKRFPKGAPTT
jgi:sodium/hydrogen antiporter